MMIFFQGPLLPRFQFIKKIGLLLMKILRKKLFSLRSGLTEEFGPLLKIFKIFFDNVFRAQPYFFGDKSVQTVS